MFELSYLLEQRREKKKELRLYQQRKNKLQPIRSNVENFFDDVIGKAINYNKKTESEVRDGAKGEVFNVENLCSAIEGEREKDVLFDGNMENVLSNIINEIGRCTEEIERLENEIRRLNREIEEAEEAQEAEE